MAGERMEWTDDVQSVQRHITRYVWTLKWCAGKRVLDAGCGIGYGTALIANVASEAEGIDISQEAANMAVHRYPLSNGCIFWHAAIEKFTPYKPFDVVVALEVLEHLDDMDAGMEKLLSLATEAVLVSLPVLAGANQWHHGRHWTVEDCDAFMARHAAGRLLEPCYQPARDSSNCEVRRRPIEDPDNVGYLQYVVWKGAM